VTRAWTRIAGCIVAVATVVACGSPKTRSTSKELTVVADGFNGPTQIADGPADLLLVAQLNGEENAATGQVVVFDPKTKAKRVLLMSLDKPTGVLWQDGVLWVMVRRGLVRAPWNKDDNVAGPVETVLDNLPFNGRSEGTLTAVDGGRFLYETSGTLIGDTPEPGSGTLWLFDPKTKTSTPVATGAKNAYAHAVLPDGRLVVTEIGDNVENPPVEEINIIPLSPAADLGWPRCAGDQDCAAVIRPTALFPKSSTPTGVAVKGNDIFVTLFVTGQLMRIPLGAWTTGQPPQPSTEVATGLKGPHTVLARPDGTLWISEHLANRIVSIKP
jgi:glucose/arabinose dehydrogenase